MFSEYDDLDCNEEGFSEDTDIETKEQFSMLHNQAMGKIELAQKTLQGNPNNPESLYNLSIAYKNGYGGLSKNKNLANDLLRKAADLGHPYAREECNRIDAQLECVQEQKDLTIERQEDARHKFDDKIGLKEAIENEIFPCVVSTSNDRGVIGSGFSITLNGLYLMHM